MSASDDCVDATKVDTLVYWVTKSLTDGDGASVPLAEARTGSGYLEGVHQTCLLLGGSATWNRIARRLVDAGVLTMDQQRYTSGLVRPS